MKENRTKYREKYILDYHHTNIEEDSEEQVKYKKKVISSIKKKLKRNHSFYYISKYAGKGVKGSLKRLYIVNEKDQIVQTYIDKESIEDNIRKHNIKHFTQAHRTDMYNDKIYVELTNPIIKDKILNGDLDKEDCDSKNVWKFLSLLKKPEHRRNIGTNHEREILE